MDAPTITLGGIKATLIRPSPSAGLALIRTPEQEAGMDLAERLALGAAALLECWPMDVAWPAPVRPRRWRFGERIGENGRAMLDELVNAGAPISALIAPSNEALQWVCDAFLKQWEVDGARDFSVAPPANSAGGASTSVENTASPPPGGMV